MQTSPYIVGICGGSASGKSFLLEQLMQSLPADQLTHISQDNYYRKYEDQQKDDEGLVNFDHPDAVDLDMLHADVMRILGGEVVTVQEYTFNNPNQVPAMIRMEPRPLLILDGLFIFYHQPLAHLMDLKVFVEADEHIKIGRRIRRDGQERGYSLDSVLRDYERFVAPMYQRYVEPTKWSSDLIVPNNQHMNKAIQVLVHYLNGVLKDRV
jgi:uridine kinase